MASKETKTVSAVYILPPSIYKQTTATKPPSIYKQTTATKPPSIYTMKLVYNLGT
jgi:hypothetical protein